MLSHYPVPRIEDTYQNAFLDKIFKKRFTVSVQLRHYGGTIGSVNDFVK